MRAQVFFVAHDGIRAIYVLVSLVSNHHAVKWKTRAQFNVLINTLEGCCADTSFHIAALHHAWLSLANKSSV